MDPYGQSGSGQSGGGTVTICPPPYVKTVPGILKIVELALCLLTFAVSLGGMWSAWGGGWVEFVAMSSFITTLIWFILHMLLTSLPNLLLSRPYEFITYCVIAVLFMISGIIAAARAPALPGSVGATAFFAFACMVVYGVDGYFQFRDWRNASQHTTTTTVTTTSASSPSDPKLQY